MDKRLFIERIEEILREPSGSLQETTRLKDLEGYDSIGLLSVIAIVDEHYGVTLDANALNRCETVGDLSNLVDKDS